MTEVMVMASPVGALRLESEADALTGVWFAGHGAGAPSDAGHVVDNAALDDNGACAPVLVEARRQLRGYFAAERRDFDLRLDPRGTDFQRRVWAELLEIPYGATASYGDIAARLGLPPGGSRAVGVANGANPIPIIIPCHRVIGSNGKLVGYGGGIDRKQWLLGLESAAAAQGSLFA